MNTDRKLAPFVAQVVPIKLDVASADYQAFARKHKKQGSGIPIVFVVRADGETMYAKSGSLATPELQSLLSTCMAESGLVLSEQDLLKVTSATNRLRDLHDADDLKGAINVINKLKGFDPEKVVSFAAPITELKAETVRLHETCKSKLDDAENALNEAESNSDRVAALRNFFGVKSQISKLAPAKSEVKRLDKMIKADKSLTSLLGGVKMILSVSRPIKTVSGKTRSIQRLEKMLKDTEKNWDAAVVAEANSTIASLKAEVAELEKKAAAEKANKGNQAKGDDKK